MLHLVCPNPALDRTILLENYQASVVNRPKLVHENAGGKSFNVAYVLQCENQTKAVDFCIHTMLGGKMGEYVAELNENSGIPLVVTQVEKNTRTCTISIDTATGATYLVYESGFELSPELLEDFTEKLLSGLESGDSIVFSGSLMKGMPDDYIKEIGNRLPAGVSLVVDTSGPALPFALESQPTVVKINDEELAELTGRVADTPEEVLEILKDYQELPYFIVTMGGKGVVAKLADSYYQLTFPKIELKNPIASGDFFLGSLCHSLASRGVVDVEAVRRACAYATANCLQWTPKVDPADVAQILEAIVVTEL